MATTVPLSNSYFPLLPAFEDLELESTLGFSLDISKLNIKTLSTTLKYFLLQYKDNYANLGCQNRSNGFIFIEIAYAALKWSKSEKQMLSMDILSRLLKAVIHFGRSALKCLRQGLTNDLRKANQNNLRICIYFLCHTICIVDEVLQHASQSKKTSDNMDDLRWLDVKAEVAWLLSNALQHAVTSFDSQKDIKITGVLIRTAAISCVIHQNWTVRTAVLRKSSQNLRKALICILCDSFLHPLSIASGVAEQTLGMLLNICLQHKHLVTFLVDMIAHLIAMEKSIGLAVLSRIISSTSENFAAVTSGRRAQLYSEVDLALTIIAEYALKRDGYLIIKSYLGKLIPLLQNDHAAIRKHIFDIIGAYLLHFNDLPLGDQQALLLLNSFLMRDRDANCRLKALSYMCMLMKEKCGHVPVSIHLVLQRVADKSKIVRLKALQIMEMFLSCLPTPVAEHPVLLCDTKTELIRIVSMPLFISSESALFCIETCEAAGRVICTPYLREPAILEFLDKLVGLEHSSVKLPIILKVLEFHLNGYDQWLQFLESRSEQTMRNLERLLNSTYHKQNSFGSNFQDMAEKAFLALEHHNFRERSLLGSLRLIALLIPVDDVKKHISHQRARGIVSTLRKYICEFCSTVESEKQMEKGVIRLIMKVLASIVQVIRRPFIAQLLKGIEKEIIQLYNNGIEGCIDFVFNIRNPYSFIKTILQLYEDELRVLDSPQPLNVLQGYIMFLGDLSTCYQFACDAFIRLFREAQQKEQKSEKEGAFDYLQQDEQKAHEEDAVLRFSNMLVSGDSSPGCYVSFLNELALSNPLPTSLRISALRSLGCYMLLSNDLAIKYKETIEGCLAAEDRQMKQSAIHLAGKLIPALPNDYTSAFDLVLYLIHDDSVKNAAFTVYASIVLERKLKMDGLLRPICDVLCDQNSRTYGIAKSLLKRITRDAGRSKYKLVSCLWSHCVTPESHKMLARILIHDVLDTADLQNDELVSSILQILALGQNDVAFFISFLHPSIKALQTLDLYLSSCPPKINIKGDDETSAYLSQFVRNCKKHISASGNDKELIGKLLDRLCTKGSRKRKSQIPSAEAKCTYNTLDDYEKAIENFKQCEINGSLWDLLRHDA